jgi:hypothetical protein
MDGRESSSDESIAEKLGNGNERKCCNNVEVIYNAV